MVIIIAITDENHNTQLIPALSSGIKLTLFTFKIQKTMETIVRIIPIMGNNINHQNHFGLPTILHCIYTYY